MKKKSCKAQGVFGMSFAVIFSIILIIFILVVAGIAINHFLGLRDCAQIGMFIEDLQKDIDDAWSSQQFSDDDAEYILPGNIEYVCFANLSNSRSSGDLENMIYSDISLYENSNGNMFFYPRENACDMPYINMKHIDLNKITELKNPKCFENDEKIVIEIEKGFTDALVNLK